MQASIINGMPPNNYMSDTEFHKYLQIFDIFDKDKRGSLIPEQMEQMLVKTRLPEDSLTEVWNLAEQTPDMNFAKPTVLMILYLVEKHKKGMPLPQEIPAALKQEVLNRLGQKAKRKSSNTDAFDPVINTIPQSRSQFNSINTNAQVVIPFSPSEPLLPVRKPVPPPVIDPPRPPENKMPDPEISYVNEDKLKAMAKQNSSLEQQLIMLKEEITKAKTNLSQQKNARIKEEEQMGKLVEEMKQTSDEYMRLSRKLQEYIGMKADLGVPSGWGKAQVARSQPTTDSYGTDDIFSNTGTKVGDGKVGRYAEPRNDDLEKDTWGGLEDDKENEF